MTLRAGNGQPRFIPTMLLGLSTSGVPAWQVGKSLSMKRACGGPMGNIAGCCTARSRCVTNMEKFSSGMDRVWTSRITNVPKNSSAEAPRSCKEASLISPKGSALPTWAAGPLMLPGSTTGLLNYFGCTASSRPAKRLLFRNTWIVCTHRIAGSWQS